MASLTRSKWIARFSLVAYVLLVCFGHALHALPGHHHEGHHHEGHAAEHTVCCPHEADNAETASHSESLAQGHNHAKSGCVFQRYFEKETQGKDEAAHRLAGPSGLQFKSTDSLELCSICELLSSPQVAAVQLDRDNGVEFVQSAIQEAYSFYHLESLAAFSARGPPEAHPLV